MADKITHISTADGRVLRFAETGHLDGIPVFIHGGTPGSYVFFAPWVAEAERLGIRLIGHDRPGYGESTPLPSRNVASVANDVAAIATHLGLKRLATVGASGGGPHALACAALLPELITAAVAMESVAPYPAEGLDWFANTDEGTTAEFRAAVQGREAMTAFVSAAADELVNMPLDAMIEWFRSMSSSAADDATLEATARWFFEASREGLKHGNAGWIDDDLAFCTPWGFDLAQIRVPTLLLHGVQDTMVPIAHCRWMAEQIPGVEARYFDHENHGTLFGRQAPVALTWLVNQMR